MLSQSIYLNTGFSRRKALVEAAHSACMALLKMSSEFAGAASFSSSTLHYAQLACLADGNVELWLS